MMDPKSKEMLDEILAKDPAELTDYDKGFLRARRSYLSEEQRKVYEEALAEQPEANSAEPVTDAAKASKSAKAKASKSTEA